MSNKIKRVIIIVLDGVGVGALPDADRYNDTGADSLGNMFKELSRLGQFSQLDGLPNLAKLGLFNLLTTYDLQFTIYDLIGCYGKMIEKSAAKDTNVGHWEIVGIVTEKPFPTYPHGFPKDLIEEFERRIGRKTLGNYPCSGTEIIKQLGEEHLKTGFPIVYTSADSVFQIAAHEEVIPIEEQYRICRIARELLDGEHRVLRVIARPFIGEPGKFIRTANRKDFGLTPPEPTLLDKIKSAGGEVIAIGKIEDIFSGQGITHTVHTKNNIEGVKETIKFIKDHLLFTTHFSLIFTNLVDFDMLWGHRRNVECYYNGLKEFDNVIPEIINSMSDEDILFITSDHGCDPTFKSHTDHTREYVPLLVYGRKIKSGVNLGIRETFADLGQTIADIFGLPRLRCGVSFKKEIM